jgi:rhodanese-related sulfurtransferase
MPQVPELTPTEFVDRWPAESQSGEVVLLDVREPEELEQACVEGVIHIPMNEIPARLDELDRAKTITVMCHGGVRSMRVAAFLMAQGFDRVFNLRGGIDAWSREVDSTVPRY